VRLFSRPGNDLTDRFPLIVEALAWLRSRSCIIDGEAVCCDDKGVPSFDRIRYRRNDGSVFPYAFDLIELNGDDLRREPLEVRKVTLASVLAKTATGRLCLPTPARWALKASCRSAKIRSIDLGGRWTGSRARTPKRQPSVRPRRTGGLGQEALAVENGARGLHG
jgi:ATP-dependent DNA ligase